MIAKISRRVLAVLALAVALNWHTVFAESALYVSDARAGKLVTVSTVDGSSTPVGSFNVPGNVASLAYDGTHNILYGSTTAGDKLVTIDPVTGNAVVVGPLGITLMHSLAYDSSTGTLYGASTYDNSLYRVDSTTGAATRIGSLGFNELGIVSGLTFNPVNNTLYGCMIISRPIEGGIVTINTLTGEGTFLFATRTLNSIAFQPETGTLYGVHNGSGVTPDALYTIDLTTKSASLVGLTGLDNSLGMEFLPVAVPEPQMLILLGVGLVVTVAIRKSRPSRAA
jgi:hypothetical protein